MAASGVLLLAAVLLVHQAAGAGRCSRPTTTGDYDCDDSCNEIGVCLAGAVWRSSVNCQATGRVCRKVAGIPTCVDHDSLLAQETYCTNNTYYTITCPAVTTTTRFPSHIDCTSYYICTPGSTTAIPTQCGGRAFNACTGTCSDQLYNGECPANSTPLCTGTNMGGIASSTDRLFYTCQLNAIGYLSPQWQVCPSGTRFSLTTARCENVGSVATCTVCAGATAVPSALQHPGTVCSYLWCHSRANFEVRNCLSGWYYLHSERGCIYGGGSAIAC